VDAAAAAAERERAKEMAEEKIVNAKKKKALLGNEHSYVIEGPSVRVCAN
jgi:hypothetical protein